jgi:hypothetical protein
LADIANGTQSDRIAIAHMLRFITFSFWFNLWSIRSASRLGVMSPEKQTGSCLKAD